VQVCFGFSTRPCFQLWKYSELYSPHKWGDNAQFLGFSARLHLFARFALRKRALQETKALKQLGLARRLASRSEALCSQSHVFLYSCSDITTRVPNESLLLHPMLLWRDELPPHMWPRELVDKELKSRASKKTRRRRSFSMRISCTATPTCLYVIPKFTIPMRSSLPQVHTKALQWDPALACIRPAPIRTAKIPNVRRFLLAQPVSCRRRRTSNPRPPPCRKSKHPQLAGTDQIDTSSVANPILRELQGLQSPQESKRSIEMSPVTVGVLWHGSWVLG
jgi:hypothetical protein